MFFVIVYTPHISFEHVQIHQGSHGRSKLLIYLVATSVSDEHNREPQHTTTNIIYSTTESTCMRIMQSYNIYYYCNNKACKHVEDWNMLPSMWKDWMYHVVIANTESTACTITACCACPAGLSGCCNHVTAILYCLEDYIHSGLQEDEQKVCTNRLQVWNQPRKKCGN